MKILTTDGNYINEKYNHEKQITNYEEKVAHMVNNGYGSIDIDGVRVAYEDYYEVNGEPHVVVKVGV